MRTSETIGKLAEALSKAQGDMTAAKKDSDNPFYRSKYADLASVWESVRQPLCDNGLSIIQTPGNSGEYVTVTTRLCHSSGEWIEGTVGVTPAKPDAQGVGTVISYLRRYSLSAIIGGYADDDDAEADRAAAEKKNYAIKSPKFPPKPASGEPDVPEFYPPDKADASEQSERRIQGRIARIDTRKGTKNNKEWVKYGITVNGQVFGTFSETLAVKAQSAIDSAVDVEITYVEEGKYKSCIDVKPIIGRDPGEEG